MRTRQSEKTSRSELIMRVVMDVPSDFKNDLLLRVLSEARVGTASYSFP